MRRTRFKTQLKMMHFFITLDWDFILKVIAPIIAMISLLFNALQYFAKRKITKSEARRELDRLNVEFGRMTARQRQEERDLMTACEGEVRFNEYTRVTVNTLTAEDNRRLAEQGAEHRREWDDLFAQMSHCQRVLGETSGLLIRKETLWDKSKRWLRQLKRPKK